MKDEERSKERVEMLRKDISKFLAKVNQDIELMEFECKVNEWNDEVLDILKDGCLNLGYVLGILNIWYDDDENQDS